MNSGTTRALARKLLTAGLIAVIFVMLQPVSAAELASIKGTVFANEQGAPLIGARVHLVQVGSHEVFTSDATDANGRFDLSGVPMASYEAAIEYDGGVYIVESPVVVSGGELVGLNLLVPRVVDAANASRSSVAGSAGFLSSPLAATLLVVGSALSVGALIESATDDANASPF